MKMFRPLTENYLNVATLPSSVAPITKPSPKIAKLLLKRKSKHESVIKQIQINFKLVNIEIDRELETEFDKARDAVIVFRDEINRQSCLLIKDDELGLLNPDQMLQIRKRGDLHFELIDAFYETIRRLEKKRSELFKTVLSKAYKNGGEISHLLPYNLLKYFGEEIANLNAISMSNYRYYAQVHTDLKLQTQDQVRVFALEFLDVRDKYRTSTSFNSVRLTRDDPTKALSSIDSQSASEFASWTKKLKFTLHTIDANTRKLIHLFKMAVVNIFNRFFKALKSGIDMLDEADDTIDKYSEHNDSVDTYQCIMEDYTERYSCDVGDLQKLWENITCIMESNIKNTYNFFNGTAHLFDAHFERTEAASVLLSKEMSLIITKHDKEAQSYEQKMSITLDKMREQSTIAKLNKELKSVNKFLDSVNRLYRTQTDMIVKVAKKYRNLVDQEIELLISEIDRFLHEHDTAEVGEDRMTWTRIPEFREPPEDAFFNMLPHQMKACKVQLEAVRNWMIGLWEAIRLYMTTCRKELTQQADRWMDSTVSKLKKREEVRIALNKPRKSRVKTKIYDVRLKELEEHLSDLDKLKRQVEQYVQQSNSFSVNLKNTHALITEAYDKQIKDIEEKAKSATKSLQIASYIEQVESLNLKTVREIETANDQSNETLQQNRRKIDELICFFSNSIKLFSEDGKYSRDEAKMFKKKIAKVQKSIPKRHEMAVRKFEGVKQQTTNDFTNSKQAILKRMERSKREFEHKEQTCEKIKELQSLIRTLAYETKFKLHRLGACIDHQEHMKKQIVCELVDNGYECLEKMTELSTFLISGSYSSILLNTIDNSFQKIRLEAQEFYSAHGAVINTEKMPSTFDEFLDKVEHYRKSFQVQAEVHRMECIEDFVESLLKFLIIHDKMDVVEDAKQKKLSENLSIELVEIKERVHENIHTKNEARFEALNSTIVQLLELLRNKFVLMEQKIESSEETKETDVVQKL